MKTSHIRRIVVAAAAALLVLTGCAAAPESSGSGEGDTTELVKLRWVVFPGTNSEFLPRVLESEGIAAKYGYTIETLTLANSNFQTALQGGSADIAQNGLISAISLPKKGLDVKVVGSFLGYGNYLLGKPGGADSVEDLKGGSLGTFSNTEIDYTVLRAATKKLYGFDINTDTKITPAAPGILNELLARGETDLALQFTSIAFAPVVKGEFEKVTTINDLIEEAGWDSQTLNLVYLLAPAWMDANPGGAEKVANMIEEGKALLQENDDLWPELAKVAQIPDDMLVQYRDDERKAISTEYSKETAAATSKFFKDLEAVLGSDAFAGGSPEIPDSIFVFPDR